MNSRNSAMKLYKIRNWNALFENNRSRELKVLNWTVVPNSHDGATYTEMITGLDGPLIFAAWVLMVQVASKCDPRGTLVRGDGKPITPLILSLKTRAPIEIFEKCLAWLENNSDWLEVETANQELTENMSTIPHEPAGIPHPPATIPHDVTKKGREGKGMEEKGISRFAPPDILESQIYGEEIGLPSREVEKFVDYYESKGWKIGKSSMKDWKAAMRNWKRNSKEFENQKNENTRNTAMGKTAADSSARGRKTLEIIARKNKQSELRLQASDLSPKVGVA